MSTLPPPQAGKIYRSQVETDFFVLIDKVHRGTKEVGFYYAECRHPDDIGNDNATITDLIDDDWEALQFIELT